MRAPNTVLALLLCVTANVAYADLITVNRPYHFLDSRAANDVGVTPGDRLQYGANSVVPNGGAGTSNPATAQQLNSITNVTVNRDVFWTPNSVSPNFYAGSTVDNAGLRGSWQLTFTNGTDMTVVATPTIGNVATVPYVNTVSFSEAGVTPTISWSLNGFSADTVAVRVRDLGTNVRPVGPPVANLFYQEYLPGNSTTYTFPANVFEFGKSYSIEIAPADLRGSFISGTGNTGNRIGEMFADTVRQSRAFFNYTPVPGDLPGTVYLPSGVTQPNGLPAYTFNVANVGSDTIFIDPVVAIGYDYEIGAGDPNFRSVTPPTGIGDDLFSLWLWTGTDFVESPGGLEGGVEHLFGGDGVSRFRILGIEVAAGLSPFDATAFVTGLSFVGPGSFTGTMTPLTVTVPEPSGLALLAGALLVLFLARRRTDSSRRQSIRSSR
jgi:hypothetical protein